MRYATVVLAALLWIAVGEPASAQGFGWFGNLFGGGQPQSEPASPGGGYGYGPDTYYAQPRRTAPRRRPPRARVQRDAPKEAPKGAPKEAPKDVAKDARERPPKKNPSMFVYVFGDSLGQLLADGLDDALSDRQDVAVVHKARGSTGLVSKDYYDWPKSIADMLSPGDETGASDKAKAEKDGDKGKKTAKADKRVAAPDTKDKNARPKVDVAVMMIGSNDRQPITEDGKRFEPGSPEWNAAYAKRVIAITKAFSDRKIPLIWVGIPITKDENFADDMAAFNDIYREAASKTGAVYVDTWEPFSDDKGDFSAFGPDINGQTVRLRSSDGIHFTKAGSRKLAHFVETHVRRAIDGKTPPPRLPTAEVPEGGKDTADKKARPAVALAKPDAGPISSLNEPPAAHHGELMKIPAPKPEPTGNTVVENANPEPRGSTVSVPAGRADDLRWPSNGATRR